MAETVQRQGHRALLSFAAIAIVVAVLVYVAAPPQGLDGYRERAAASAETMASQVETAALWAETRAADKATGPAALVGFEEAEEDAVAAASKFEGYEPPDEAARLRGRFVSLTDETTAALALLRIAAEQGRWGDLPALASPLGRLAAEWSRFEERAEP